MGSINCKEYAPAASNQTSDSAGATNVCGTTGSYQAKTDCASPATKDSNTINMAEYTEAVSICNVNDLDENTMKPYNFMDNRKVLIIKQNGAISAIGNKCSHYGAPLHTGALGRGRVRCPWHGACFNIETGDIEDFPGMDSVPAYRVEVSRDGQVKVRAKRKDMENTKRIKDMVQRDEKNDQTYVIVGGGPSGAVCAETLRQEGFSGRIVMLCKEEYLPYDRVKVSKSPYVPFETLRFRAPEFYEKYGIETMLGVSATKVNPAHNTVDCSNGYSIKYDKMFIATGCSALKVPIPGADLQNVFTVREYADARDITNAIKDDMNVVCLGGSFVALESAASFVSKVKSMTLVLRDNVPLKQSFGDQIGARVVKLFEENNIKMKVCSGITEIVGNAAGAVHEIVLKDGSKLPCDILIMGTGARMNTEFLNDSGIKLVNGAVEADKHLQTNLKNIYVGGDIAHAPVYSFGNEKITIGHFQLAQYHGRIAALNMIGTEKQEVHSVPFFFTMMFGKGLRYAGHGPYKDIFFDGDLESLVFAAYYINDQDKVVAVASCGRDPIVSQFAELQSQGKTLEKCDVIDAENPTAWTEKLKTPCTGAC